MRFYSSMVQQALITGKLVKQPCNRCGVSKVEAHHEDYTKPLEVIWLCRKCHQVRHAELRRTKSDDLFFRVRIPRPLVAAIDTYWHKEWLMSRAETVRELLTYALEQKLGRPENP